MLNPIRLGIAGGILWGISLLVMTFIRMNVDYGDGMIKVFESIYPWYTVSVKGAFIGFFWGFLDSFTGLFILAWIYNKLGGSE